MADSTVSPGEQLGASGFKWSQALTTTNNYIFKHPGGRLFKNAALQINGTWNGKTATIKESLGNSYSEALQDSTPANITFTADAIKIMLTNRPSEQIIVTMDSVTGVTLTAVLVAELL